MVVIFGISSGIGKEIAKSISKDEKVFGTYNSTNNLEDLDMNNIILEKASALASFWCENGIYKQKFTL